MVPLGQCSSRSHSHMSSLPGRPFSSTHTRSSSFSGGIDHSTHMCGSEHGSAHWWWWKWRQFLYVVEMKRYPSIRYSADREAFSRRLKSPLINVGGYMSADT